MSARQQGNPSPLPPRSSDKKIPSPPEVLMQGSQIHLAHKTSCDQLYNPCYVHTDILRRLLCKTRKGTFQNARIFSVFLHINHEYKIEGKYDTECARNFTLLGNFTLHGQFLSCLVSALAVFSFRFQSLARRAGVTLPSVEGLQHYI
jgi:hypothetical protein